MTGWVLLVSLWGCSPKVSCDDPSVVLVQGADPLTCGDTDVVVEWTETLASRRAPKQRPLIRGAIQKRFFVLHRLPQNGISLHDNFNDRRIFIPKMILLQHTNSGAFGLGNLPF